MYRFLLVVHVLTGMVWFGGGVVLHLTLRGARHRDGGQAADRVLSDNSWADTWLAVPAPILILVTGIAMVIMDGSWTFTQAWVLFSVGLVVLYETVALSIGGGEFRRMTAAREADAVGGAGFSQALDRVLALGLSLLIILILIVVLMVLKPGV